MPPLQPTTSVSSLSSPGNLKNGNLRAEGAGCGNRVAGLRRRLVRARGRRRERAAIARNGRRGNFAGALAAAAPNLPPTGRIARNGRRGNFAGAGRSAGPLPAVRSAVQSLFRVPGLGAPCAVRRDGAGAGRCAGRSQDLLGQVPSASQGSFGQADLQVRPLSRPGEIVELVPGMIATQHSGSGKANQFFVRGLNLDHGTDFLVRLDGTPLNLPSHGHGQGYLDINWLIPELIESGDYKFGPYYADVGDFSSAGTARPHFRRARCRRASPR